jgi:hypothetical protein
MGELIYLAITILAGCVVVVAGLLALIAAGAILQGIITLVFSIIIAAAELTNWLAMLPVRLVCYVYRKVIPWLKRRFAR